MCLLLYVNTLVNILINTYLNNSYCFLSITQDDLNYNSAVPFINVKLKENADLQNSIQTLNFGCQDIIIQSDHPIDVINELEKQMKLQVQRFNYRKYFILPTENSVDLDVVPSIPVFAFVPDVLIAVPDIYFNTTNNTQTFNNNECELTFKLITNKFSGNDHNDIIVLDYWYSKNMTFEYNSNLFPDKLSNMQGRVLRVGTFTYEPYTIVGPTFEESDGTEMRVANEYFKRHNLTVEFLINMEDRWGEIYENWTGIGVLGDLVMDKVDIAYGSIYSWYHEFGFLELSSPTVRTGITCMAPAPRLLSSWFAPFLPFDLILWMACLISFAVAYISYTVILKLTVKQERRENLPDDFDTSGYFEIFLLIYRIYFLQSFPALRAIEKTTIRYLLTTILILSLLISTSYNSGLASSMTIPRYEKAIKTVQDLADSNINWGNNHEAWIFSILHADQPAIVKIRNNFRVLTNAELVDRLTKRNYAYSLERLPAGHYAVEDYITEEAVINLLLMSEDIYWAQCVIMAPKSSPLMPSLDSLILRIHETGLPAVWESQVALRYLDYQVQLKIRLLSQQHNPDQDPIKLKFVHIQGSYALWFCGLVISFISLLVEIIVFKYTQRQAALNTK